MEGRPVAWNETAKISCVFSVRCPKTWANLSPTDNAGIRHCPECNRDVHLALTEQDFREHAQKGRCVAVKVLDPELSAEDGKRNFFFGGTELSDNPDFPHE